MKEIEWKGETCLPLILKTEAILKRDWESDEVYGLTEKILKRLNDPKRLRRCEACGVYSVFASMHLDRVDHPSSKYSYAEMRQQDTITVTALYRCDDVRECLRRTTMKMK